MARVRRQCTMCRRKFQVYKGGRNDVQFYICPDCKEGMNSLVNHKPYVQDVQVKGEML